MKLFSSLTQTQRQRTLSFSSSATIQKERRQDTVEASKYDTPYYFDVHHFNLKP